MNRLVLLLASATILGGCSSTPMKEDDVGIMERPPETVDAPPKETVSVGGNAVPNWFLELPEDTETRIYAVGTGYSDDLQFAFDKAVHEAKVNLADKIAAKSTAEIKTFISDNGKGGQGMTARKSQKVSKSGFKDVDVSKYVVVHRAVVEDRRYFRTYVQVALDPNDRVIGGEVINAYDPRDDMVADKAMEDI